MRSLYTWYLSPFPHQIANLFRKGLALVTLLTALTWLGYLRDYFTNAGLITSKTAELIQPGMSIFFWYDAPWFVYVCYAVLLGSLGLLFWGKFTQIVTVLSYVLFLSFCSRMPAFGYGGTQVLQIFLFLSMVVPFFQFVQRKDGTGWALRLIQLQLAFVYFFSAIEKMQVSTWLHGQELQNLAYTSLSYLPTSHFLTNPWLAMVFTYYTLAVELGFIFLIWHPKTRRPMLVATILLHLGIAIFLNVTYFSWIMFVGLMLFATPEDVALVRAYVRKAVRRG